MNYASILQKNIRHRRFFFRKICIFKKKMLLCTLKQNITDMKKIHFLVCFFSFSFTDRRFRKNVYTF